MMNSSTSVLDKIGLRRSGGEHSRLEISTRQARNGGTNDGQRLDNTPFSLRKAFKALA